MPDDTSYDTDYIEELLDELHLLDHPLYVALHGEIFAMQDHYESQLNPNPTTQDHV